MNTFDIMYTPLRGINLIEASAGTGKTHAIAGLFLRLILEKEFLINEILVVTFTEAATEELRDRIRKRLRAAHEVLTGAYQALSGDDLLVKAVTPYRDNKRKGEAINNALKDFDKAAIYTIHGFCQKMLREHAFECGALFDTELITEQHDLIRELIDDFWRKHFYDAPPLFLQYAFSAQQSRATFMKLVNKQFFHPDLTIVPPIEKIDIEDAHHNLRRLFYQLKDAWFECRPAVEQILLQDSSLNRTTYQPQTVATMLIEMDSYLESDAVFPLFKGFEKFTSARIAQSIKKNGVSPNHEFFERCNEFYDCYTATHKAFERYMLYLKQKLFAYIRKTLQDKKRVLNVRSFDDLIGDIYYSLKTGSLLASAIRKKFKAALIDEFQDTDPVQYDIFFTLFNTPEHILYLIGDPKQAIYRFRGADIFAYLKAASHIPDQHRHTLTTNWRAEPNLIGAINRLFLNVHDQFIFKDIQFHTIAPAPNIDRDVLKISDATEPPLQVWFIDQKYANKDDGTIHKGSAEPLVARMVAAEIARLARRGQDGGALIGDRPLCPGDIAVLVRKNRQARLIQEELVKVSVPSVLYGAESIFESPEAREVVRVISAIAEPSSAIKLKAALATDMLGFTANTLVALNTLQNEWEVILGRFYQYHEEWNKSGFIKMFRLLLQKEGICRRLLLYPDGERRLTNVLQCGEVLHRAESEQKLGMKGLIKWFVGQREGEETSEEYQIRLETDENAVKLVTIHRSKGLEYPIVFCPFPWDSSVIKKEPFAFHDPENKNHLTLDIGTGNSTHALYASREELAENMRLLYVALTRAKHRCYLVWGKINGAETAAPAYLFHQPRQFISQDIIAELADRVASLSYEEMFAEVSAIQDGQGYITVSHLPHVESAPYNVFRRKATNYQPRFFTGTIQRDWTIASYSSLIYEDSSYTDQPDYDHIGNMSVIEYSGDPHTDIFSFPRGIRAGNCIHSIFERLDFTLSQPEKERELIRSSLAQYGLDENWIEALWTMVQNVLVAPLDSSRPEFILKNVHKRDRRHELEFYFPFDNITAQGLSAIFSQAQYGEFAALLDRLGFKSEGGFMRGFMDMVFTFNDQFYIIDWKSNYLGNCVENYSLPLLQKVMHENYYILQYHIYAVALHRYLALRKADYAYEKHFGGIYYLFVRGINPQQGSFGIYYDRPAAELITYLSSYFSISTSPDHDN